MKDNNKKFKYKAVPPNRTFIVKVLYQYKGEGKPLEYPPDRYK